MAEVKKSQRPWTGG